MEINIENLSILKCPHVHMKNESTVIEKLNAIVCQGPGKLQFVTDFDQTVTKQHENGTPTLTSVGILFQSKLLPESKLNAVGIARTKYKTKTMNPTISIEQRIKATNEVCEIVHNCLQGYEFDRREIEDLVCTHGPSFRDGTKDLFLKFQNLNIPVAIVSAGLSDVIAEQLKQENIKHDSMSIIANQLKFNGAWLDGFQDYENCIDAFNKHEHVSRYIDTKILASRKNIILMGDNVGDATMVRQYENDGIVLKIGFYYGQASGGLEIFKDAFDIVLNDDQTMNVILDIVKLLE